MLEPGTTVELDGNAGSGWRLPAGIQSGETAQPAGLREPSEFCGAELSIPSSGRASPSLRWGWTKNKQKHKLNHVSGLTHGLEQKSEPGQVQVKAAGGGRDLDGLILISDLGATRCGATATAAML